MHIGPGKGFTPVPTVPLFIPSPADSPVDDADQPVPLSLHVSLSPVAAIENWQLFSEQPNFSV